MAKPFYCKDSMAEIKHRQSWDYVKLLCWLVVLSGTLPWAIPAVASEESVLPPEWLFHKTFPKDNPEAGGLHAEYFDSNGNFVSQRVEGPIDHGYDMGPFDSKSDPTVMFGGLLRSRYQSTPGRLWGDRFTPMDAFEEWLSGWIKVPSSGCYELRLGVDDFIEVSLADKPIRELKYDNIQAAGSTKIVINLEADKLYNIRMRFKNRLGSASLRFGYKQLNETECGKPKPHKMISTEEILNRLKAGKPVNVFGGEIIGDLDLRDINAGDIKSEIVIRGAKIHGSFLAGLRRDEWGKRSPVHFRHNVDFTGTRFEGQM